MIMNRYILLIFLMLLTGCRSWFSEKPPIHPNPNLDWQPKYKSQKYLGSKPEHTIQYLDKTTNHSGKKNGEYIKTIPIVVNKDLLDLGEKKYNINCSTCHTKTGNGTKSVIAKRGWVPSNILEKTTISRTDGELYEIVSNGIRTMPGYKKKLSENERWAVVAYIRALQKIDNTKLLELNNSDIIKLNK